MAGISQEEFQKFMDAVSRDMCRGIHVPNQLIDQMIALRAEREAEEAAMDGNGGIPMPGAQGVVANNTGPLLGYPPPQIMGGPYQGATQYGGPAPISALGISTAAGQATLASDLAQLTRRLNQARADVNDMKEVVDYLTAQAVMDLFRDKPNQKHLYERIISQGVYAVLYPKETDK